MTLVHVPTLCAIAFVVVVNSLLATLNSRYALKGEGVRGDPSTVGDTTTSVLMTTPVRTILTQVYPVSD